MNKLVALAVAAAFAVTAGAALAADPPKNAVPSKTAAKPALEKPASVSADAWAKMSDAEKAKAVEAAKKDGSAKPAKKEKKGGC